MCLGALVTLGGPVAANPIILAPSATTLTTGQVRAEAALSPNNNQGRYFWFGTGISQFEVNLIRYDQPNSKPQNSFGAQWDIMPQTMFSPAVAVGVTDISSLLAKGRRVMSWRPSACL